MKNIFLFLLLLFFAGCDGKITATVYDKSKIGEVIEEVELVATDKISQETAKRYLAEEGFLVQESPYMVQVEYRNYTQTCNNPLVKSSGNYDYDGFVKVSLLYEGKKVYAAQRDFRGEIRESLIAGLLDEMIEDMQMK